MNTRYIFAAILIFIGSILLLDRFGVLSLISYMWDWWPTGMIGVGAYILWKENKSWIVGASIVTIGAILQADYLGILPIGLWDALWPVILILSGIYLLMGKKQYDEKNSVKKKNPKSKVTK